ncbi:MAG: hypothetical protein ACOCP8_07290 [archaeon]
MGMFDYIICEYPLPIKDLDLKKKLKKAEWQTKDLPESHLAYYKINKDGILEKENYDLIENPSENNFKKDNISFAPFNFTGEIIFYTSIDNIWYEFYSIFKNGILQDADSWIDDNTEIDNNICLPPKKKYTTKIKINKIQKR